jgi:hypothetical protein
LTGWPVLSTFEDKPIPDVISMKTYKWIQVRALEPNDFAFVRRLSSRQSGFTVPPPYVLWLLRRTNPKSCIIAEHKKYGPLAYLLAAVGADPKDKMLYVWQLAASPRGKRTGAIDVILLALRDFVRRERVRGVLFSVEPGSSKFRAIKRYAYSLSARGFKAGKPLPNIVSRKEREYTIRVK